MVRRTWGGTQRDSTGGSAAWARIIRVDPPVLSDSQMLVLTKHVPWKFGNLWLVVELELWKFFSNFKDYLVIKRFMQILK